MVLDRSIIQDDNSQVIAKDDPDGNVDDVSGIEPQMRNELERTCGKQPDKILYKSQKMMRDGCG